mmetsp:Transcript_26523/g.66701  ORF Transcript_26523/g.66701 Transcript_26523/m.66701 type:complete len:225 (-) Transcript_26523:783-1457(-)
MTLSRDVALPTQPPSRLFSPAASPSSPQSSTTAHTILAPEIPSSCSTSCTTLPAASFGRQINFSSCVKYQKLPSCLNRAGTFLGLTRWLSGTSTSREGSFMSMARLGGLLAAPQVLVGSRKHAMREEVWQKSPGATGPFSACGTNWKLRPARAAEDSALIADASDCAIDRLPGMEYTLKACWVWPCVQCSGSRRYSSTSSMACPSTMRDRFMPWSPSTWKSPVK